MKHAAACGEQEMLHPGQLCRFVDRIDALKIIV
jgi:hypothetical protein